MKKTFLILAIFLTIGITKAQTIDSNTVKYFMSDLSVATKVRGNIQDTIYFNGFGVLDLKGNAVLMFSRKSFINSGSGLKEQIELRKQKNVSIGISVDRLKFFTIWGGGNLVSANNLLIIKNIAESLNFDIEN